MIRIALAAVALTLSASSFAADTSPSTSWTPPTLDAPQAKPAPSTKFHATFAEPQPYSPTTRWVSRAVVAAAGGTGAVPIQHADDLDGIAKDGTRNFDMVPRSH